MAFSDYIYMNGNIILYKDACLSIYDRGFLYGDGFFTTIRSDKGKLFFFKEHIWRLKRSCKIFKIRFPSSIEDISIFKQLLEVNKLDKCCAVVKVIITRGKKVEPGLPYGDSPTYIITANSYNPPYEKYKKGWYLISFDMPRLSPIAAYKSLNYLYNMWAREHALEQGADEVVLIGNNGFVTETSVGTILFFKDGKWFTPYGDYILPGITIKMLGNIWAQKGIIIKHKKTTLTELIDSDQIWILNSLIGIMPVSRLNDHIFIPIDNWQYADMCREELWNYAINYV